MAHRRSSTEKDLAVAIHWVGAERLHAATQVAGQYGGDRFLAATILAWDAEPAGPEREKAFGAIVLASTSRARELRRALRESERFEEHVARRKERLAVAE